MSGVASIGSRVKLHAPTAATASVSVSMRKRCAIANRTMRSRRDLSVFMARALLLEIRLDDVALLDHDLVAGGEPLEHLRVHRVAVAELQGARFVRVALAHEHDGVAFEGLQR